MQGHDSDLLIPLVDAIKTNLEMIVEAEFFNTTQLVAESGYHSERNIENLFLKNRIFNMSDDKQESKFEGAERKTRYLTRLLGSLNSSLY